MASQTDYGIEIRRAGQHPYMPGAARFSTWIMIVLWWFGGAVFVMEAVTPTGRNILMSIVILCLGMGAMWGAGVYMAKDNPFHQEIILRFIVRALRRRTDLET
jgi:hypothetical protein